MPKLKGEGVGSVFPPDRDLCNGDGVQLGIFLQLNLCNLFYFFREWTGGLPLPLPEDMFSSAPARGYPNLTDTHWLVQPRRLYKLVRFYNHLNL